MLCVRDAARFAAPHALNAPLVVEGLLGAEWCLFLGECYLPLQNWHLTDSSTTNQVILKQGGTLFTLKKTASSYSPAESKNCIHLNVKETRPISMSQTGFDTLLSKKQQNPIVSQLGMDHLEAIWTSRFYCTCKRYFTVISLRSQCFFIGRGWGCREIK